MKTNQLSVKLFGKLFGGLLVLGGIYCLGVSKVVAAPLQGDPAYKAASNDEARAHMKTEEASERFDAKITLRKATDLYSAIVKGPHGQVPEGILAKAQCVAVIPEVITGAIIVGGSHGVGVASCRENNRWSPPAFLKMNSVSLGAQVGGKSSDLVLFMVNESAKAALRKGNVTLGSDVSVTAGTFDRSVDTSRGGVIAYARTEGVFAGASLSGGAISGDDDNTAAFYGPKASFASLLAGSTNVASNTLAEGFTTLLPK